VSAAAPGPFPDLSAALESERDAWCAHLLRQAELLLVKVQGRDSGRGDCVQELDARMTQAAGTDDNGDGTGMSLPNDSLIAW
jgi:alpha-D-ribose 1-methylphosphonate 5-triphosphate synthase subunit PhnG